LTIVAVHGLFNHIRHLAHSSGPQECAPNVGSSGSAVFAGLTIVTDTLADRQTTLLSRL